jgi:hypothetical protein
LDVDHRHQGLHQDDHQDHQDEDHQGQGEHRDDHQGQGERQVANLLADLGDHFQAAAESGDQTATLVRAAAE